MSGQWPCLLVLGILMTTWAVSYSATISASAPTVLDTTSATMRPPSTPSSTLGPQTMSTSTKTVIIICCSVFVGIPVLIFLLCVLKSFIKCDQRNKVDSDQEKMEKFRWGHRRKDLPDEAVSQDEVEKGNHSVQEANDDAGYGSQNNEIQEYYGEEGHGEEGYGEEGHGEEGHEGHGEEGHGEEGHEGHGEEGHGEQGYVGYENSAYGEENGDDYDYNYTKDYDPENPQQYEYPGEHQNTLAANDVHVEDYDGDEAGDPYRNATNECLIENTGDDFITNSHPAVIVGSENPTSGIPYDTAQPRDEEGVKKKKRRKEKKEVGPTEETGTEKKKKKKRKKKDKAGENLESVDGMNGEVENAEKRKKKHRTDHEEPIMETADMEMAGTIEDGEQNKKKKKKKKKKKESDGDLVEENIENTWDLV